MAVCFAERDAQGHVWVPYILTMNPGGDYAAFCKLNARGASWELDTLVFAYQYEAWKMNITDVSLSNITEVVRNNTGHCQDPAWPSTSAVTDLGCQGVQHKHLSFLP